MPVGPYAIAAQLYRDAGWTDVLPLPPKRKAEPPTGFTGAAGAHPSAADILAWIEERGDGNIAIRLPENVVGLDVDSYDGRVGAQTLADKQQQWGLLPPTWRTTSRSDGRSGILWYRQSSQVGHYTDLPNVEVLHAGWRYACVWPSEHPNGGIYQWYDAAGAVCDPPSPEQLPFLPEAWSQGLAATNGTAYTKPSLPSLLEHGIPPGAQQDSILRDIVWSLRIAEVPEEFAHRLWVEVVSKTPLTRPEWPWSERDWQRHWEGADRKVDPPVSTWEPGDALLAKVRNGSWLDQQVFEPLRYVVPDLIAEGSSLLVGPPKIGKSFFVLACALARAGAQMALFGAITVEPGPTLYLALEDGDRRMQTRCRKLLDGQPLPEAFDYATAVEYGRVLETIKEWVKRHPGAVPFVILDTLGVVMPPAQKGETAYARDYRVGRELKTLIDGVHGALLTNHHDRKAQAEDFVAAVSGTHGLAGSMDSTIVLKRKRFEESGLLMVTGRDVTEGDYAVRFESGKWLLEGKNLAEASAVAQENRETGSSSADMTQILKWIAKNASKDRPVAPRQVALALGLPDDKVRQYLRRAAEKGRLVNPAYGYYYSPLTLLAE